MKTTDGYSPRYASHLILPHRQQFEKVNLKADPSDESLHLIRC